MRIKTIAGVAFAGAAAAAVIAGGVAYANDGGTGTGERVRIVYDNQDSGTSNANLREDCPEKGGGSPAPGSESPANPEAAL